MWGQVERDTNREEREEREISIFQFLLLSVGGSATQSACLAGGDRWQVGEVQKTVISLFQSNETHHGCENE